MIDDQTLAELEKTQPELVAQYRAKMGGPSADLQSAQRMQDYGGIANAAGSALTALGNARRAPDAILHNSMQNLGRAPSTVATPEMQYDGSAIDKLTAQGVSRAKDAQSQAGQDFQAEQRLVDIGRSRSQQDKASAAQDRESDPNSPESQAARDYLKSVLPSAANIAGFDRMSAAQVAKASPQLFDKYKMDEASKARREDNAQRSADRQSAAAERSADRAAMAGMRRQDKQEEREYKAEQVEKANTEKKKGTLNEIEDRRTNIKQNIGILKKMIESNGTWEATGSHNQDMDRLVDQVATDMAKLSDPASVARPSEVEQVKANLVKSGFGNKNSTALDILNNFEGEVDRRADNAYAIRQIEKPKAGGATGSFHGTDLPD